MEVAHLDEFLAAASKHGLSPHDCCVVAGAALSHYGIRESAAVDFVCGSRVREQAGFGNADVWLTRNVRLLSKDGVYLWTGITDDQEVYHSTLHGVSLQGVKFLCKELLYVNVVSVLLGLSEKRTRRKKDAEDSFRVVESILEGDYNEEILAPRFMSKVREQYVDGVYAKSPRNANVIWTLDFTHRFEVEEDERFWSF